MDHPLAFPNGSVITRMADLLVGETFGGRYTAFDLDERIAHQPAGVGGVRI